MRCLHPSEPAKTATKQWQSFGAPGWLALSPGPRVEWIPREGPRQEISAVIDERMCCSTLLRAERLSPTRFLVADMLYLNGRYVWATHSFAQRSKWVRDLLAEFHTMELAELWHKDDVEPMPVRGWEHYTDSPGMAGCYEALPPMTPTKWRPTDHPDIWVNAAGHRLEVRTLELSKRLRKNPIIPSRFHEGRVEILAG